MNVKDVAQPDWIDEILDFGALRTGTGTAFYSSPDGNDTEALVVPVAKSWGVIGNRSFLIESVEFDTAVPSLDKLPQAQSLKGASLQPEYGRKAPSLHAQISKPTPMPTVSLETRMARDKKAPTTKTLAMADKMTARRAFANEPGFTIDWQLLGSATNFTFKGDTTYYVSGTVNLSGNTVIEGGTVVKYTNSFTTLNILNALDCRTSPYRPAIFTSKDDNTVGETVTGSTGSPSGYYALTALNLDYVSSGLIYNLSHLRISYAVCGISFNRGTGHVLSHAQLTHCYEPLASIYADVSARNVLIYDSIYAIYSSGTPSTVRGENMTLDLATALNYNTTVLLTNSIVVGMPNSGYSGVYNQYASTSTGIFQTVGAGSHYLATNGWRNVGTTNINPSLSAALKYKTTYPPTMMTNQIVVDTLLTPIVPRDTDTPDLGYHFDPIDYAFSGTVLTNATLLLTNGVAVGVFGINGLEMQSGAKLVCEGTPLSTNRWVRYPAVQEQSIPWGATNWNLSLINVAATYTTLPSLNFRFTDVSLLTDTLYRRYFVNVNTYSMVQNLSMTDCQLRGGYLYFLPYYADARTMTLAVTNCLVENENWSFTQGYSGSTVPFAVYFRNNLFRTGTVGLTYNATTAGWQIYDNLFDGATLANNGTYTPPNGYNGYNGTTQLPGGSGNVILGGVTYQSGPLGNYYQPSSLLFNVGSRLASAAGLYHYTVMTNQTKEAGSQVDIGLHYVALNNGVLADTDGDGLPDYFEDRNGNGSWDAGETYFNNSDSDGDGIPDAWEVANGLNPLTNDASSDPDGDGQTNYQEYLAQTNPHDTMVVAWGNNISGQCNVPPGLRDVVSISGGYRLSLALKKNGTVFAWGLNNFSQTNLPNYNNIINIDAGTYNGVEVDLDGIVHQWGVNPVSVPGDLANVIAVSTGYDHSLALKREGTVIGWGDIRTPAAVVPLGLNGVVSIGAGWNHSVAVKNNGSIIPWGINAADLNWNLLDVPCYLTNVVQVSAGALHSVVLRSDGTVDAWGCNADKQCSVPSGLNKVVAVAAGRDYSMALKADGTVVQWGFTNYHPIPLGLSNVIAIAAGDDHCLAIRKGQLFPIIVEQPTDTGGLPGDNNVSFSVRAASLGPVSYQWLFNGANIPGATSSTYTINNMQYANQGNYSVVVANGAGSMTSTAAGLYVVQAPVITNSIPTPGTNWFTDTIQLTVAAWAAASSQYPIFYQWYKGANPISGATNSTYSLSPYGYSRASLEGDYTVKVWNVVGTNTSSIWKVKLALRGMAGATGDNSQGQCDWPANLTNTIALASGELHSAAAREDGTVTQWGVNWANVPTSVTNVVAISAGRQYTLALRENGTLVGWGTNGCLAAIPPTGLTGVKSISAGGDHALALQTNGNITAWGVNTSGQTNVPGGLVNVMSVAAGGAHSLALRADGTVAAWGLNSSGQATVPGGLANVAAIAAGANHSLVLKRDGSVQAWGDNSSGQCSVPATATNIFMIAAGANHSVALRNDGVMVSWGRGTEGQLINSPGLSQVKLLAAGGNQTLLSVFSSPLVYPVDAARDLLLVYNSNSPNSTYVKNYYLSNRPLASSANVLGINCTNANLETFLPVEFTNLCLNPLLSWLGQHPTIHPQYIVLFLDIPSRVNTNNTPWQYQDGGDAWKPSVSVQLRSAFPGIKPFITHINMGDTNDCRAYIDKLSVMASTNCPGKLVLSASAGGYNNTTYCLDNVSNLPGNESKISNAIPSLLSAGVSSNSIYYLAGAETNSVLPHILQATNVAAYISWGCHSSLGVTYATDPKVQLLGNSSWYIIETIESYNGIRMQATGYFLQWFSSSAFGGTNYSRTPVGAVTNVDEPAVYGCNDPAIYFSYWSRGKLFGIAAWESQITPFFQAVGDPLIKR